MVLDDYMLHPELVAWLALVGLWQCDMINLPSFPIFIFQLLSSIPLRLYLLSWLA